MKKFEIALLIGIIFSVILGSLTSFAEDCEEIRENVIRLHIIANSDSDYDQSLKLKVRDAVLEHSGEVFDNSQNKTDAKAHAQQNLDNIKNTVIEEINKNGADFPVKVSLVNMYFTTREYETFTMPAGYYDAVRIEIGEAKGQNWWCVMFPPMCIPAASEKNDTLEIEDKIMEIGSPSIYKPKFAIIEALEYIQSKATPITATQNTIDENDIIV